MIDMFSNRRKGPIWEKTLAIDDLEQRLKWAQGEAGKLAKREEINRQVMEGTFLAHKAKISEFDEESNDFVPVKRSEGRGTNAFEAATRWGSGSSEESDFAIYQKVIQDTQDRIMIRDKVAGRAQEMESPVDRQHFLIDVQNDDQLKSELRFLEPSEFVEEIEKIKNQIEQNLVSKIDNMPKGKIIWTGSSIELITLFYDLLQSDMIRCTKTDIARLLAAFFEDKSGNPISEQYSLKILKDQNEKSANRVDLSEFG